MSTVPFFLPAVRAIMVPFSCLRPSASQQSSFASCLSHSPTSFCASTTTYALAPTPFCHPDASCVQVSSMICRPGLPGLEVCFSFLPSPVFVPLLPPLSKRETKKEENPHCPLAPCCFSFLSRFCSFVDFPGIRSGPRRIHHCRRRRA
ncbi:hypothetical protein BKA57DRAFT_473070 [Linnemannia elongata]|nr:hypothetical protein BKA57DRAFT_473070 [Linnemannia elongata]